MTATRITGMLGSKFPVIQGAMRGITLGKMAATVSAAGGFGQIAASGLSGDRLRHEIQVARKMTDKPFGVNIALHRPNAFEALEIALEAGIAAVTSSGGNPAELMTRLGGTGMKVLHKVSTIRMGLKAQDAGVDAVIATGFEAGGHGGKSQMTTFCLIPQLADALRIPVVAAGGIGDARGVLAAMALGAEGVEVGTRFAATAECDLPDFFKTALLEASDGSTLLLGEDIMPLRVLRNPAADALNRRDPGAGPRPKVVTWQDEGATLQNCIMPSGQVAGLIQAVEPVDRLLDGWRRDCGSLLTRLQVLFGDTADET